jgi:hypothetical protein
VLGGFNPPLQIAIEQQVKANQQKHDYRDDLAGAQSPPPPPPSQPPPSDGPQSALLLSLAVVVEPLSRFFA